MRSCYSIKEFITKPIVCKISSEEEALRNYLMNQIIDAKAPLSIKEHKDVQIIRKMAENNILALNNEDEIVALYPVSAIETDKKVIFNDGRYAYAMCALDALGFHYAFNEEIRIESKCSHCGSKIVLKVKDGRVEVLEAEDKDTIYVLCADLDNMENWSCSCCNIMHFFSCKQALDEWVNKNNIQRKYFALDLESANKLSWLLFSK